MERDLKSIIAVAQMTSTSDKQANWNQLEQLVGQAVQDGAQMVFLPEGCDYIASSRQESLALSEDITGNFVCKLKDLAKRKQVWLSVGGIHIKSQCSSDQRLSNMHLVISSEGSVCGQYSKTHLFSNTIPGVSINEGDYVRPGDAVAAPVPTPAGNVGLAICYDLRFPELSQALRRLGAHILTFPSAFTVATGNAHWHTLLRARAIECQCYVVAAAQTGQHNAKRTSFGHALVVDPWGRVLCELAEGTGVATAQVDLAVMARVRREMPCLQHSRQDLVALDIQPRNSCSGNSPLLSHVTPPPPPGSLSQFGSVTVPGEATFLNTRLSFAFSNLYPKLPGHTLVSPRRVVPRFTELSEGEVCDLAQLLVLSHRTLCARHQGVQQCEVALQDGPQSGQTIQHVHVHLLPLQPHEPEAAGGASLLSPDVSSVSQSPAALKQSQQDKVAAMVAEATALRASVTPALLHGSEEGSLHIPLPMQLVDVKNAVAGRRVSDTEVPETALCFRTENTFTYCVQGDWQKGQFIVQLVREVDTLSDLRANEAHELLAAAQQLQVILQRVSPGLSTTFILKPRTQQCESVQVHVLPWLVAREPSDEVYSYISNYQRAFGGDSERSLAAAVRTALYSTGPASDAAVATLQHLLL